MPVSTDAEHQHRGVHLALAVHLQRHAPVFGEFRGVAQQVEKALPQLNDIGVHGAGIRGHIHHQVIAFLSHECPNGAGGLLHQGGDLDVLGEGVHAVRLDFAEVEHVVDEAEEVAGVGLDLAEVGQQARLTQVLDLLLHHLAVADDGRQRRAQLMAHVGQERALRPVGRLGGLLGGR